MTNRLLLSFILLVAGVNASANHINVRSTANEETNTHSVINDETAEISKDLSYNSFFLEALMQRQKGNNDAAFDLLQYCTKLNPNAAEA